MYKLLTSIVVWALMVLSVYGQSPAHGGEFQFPAGTCLTDADRAAIQIKLEEQVALLRAEGVLPPAEVQLRSSHPLFEWPVVSADERFFNVDGVSNYVDHSSTGSIVDFECGNRSYNGHKGLDIYTWPFTFYQMDNEVAHIVAAAAGTIIFKQDGNYDRQCSWGPGVSWNAVYIQHADGSIAWYGHMKDGSLTSKGVGATVAAGEYLGVVGSSGFSTGPHLHLEVYDAAGSLIDPFAGSCNLLNTDSWWNTQEPYRNSRLNLLSTHSAVPVFPGCPGTETPSFEDIHYQGDLFHTAIYLRDQQPGQTVEWKIFQGDGSLWTSLTQNLVSTYSSSWWYYNWIAGTGSVPGIWRLEVTYQGEVYNHYFKVCVSPTNCPCYAPIGLNVDVLSSTAGLFSWQGDPSSSGFQMSGGKVGGPSGTKITFNDSQLIPVLEPGSTYGWQVRAMCSDGSISPFSSTHTFSTPSLAPPLTEKIEAGQVGVYPNPADNFLQLTTQADRLRLFALQGALMLEEVSTSRVDLSEVPAGIYLVEIQIGNATTFDKIVVEH